jgi:hypothetical protein
VWPFGFSQQYGATFGWLRRYYRCSVESRAGIH